MFLGHSETPQNPKRQFSCSSILSTFSWHFCVIAFRFDEEQQLINDILDNRRSKVNFMIV